MEVGKIISYHHRNSRCDRDMVLGIVAPDTKPSPIPDNNESPVAD
jgi:hypothetical protein